MRSNVVQKCYDEARELQMTQYLNKSRRKSLKEIPKDSPAHTVFSAQEMTVTWQGLQNFVDKLRKSAKRYEKYRKEGKVADASVERQDFYRIIGDLRHYVSEIKE